MRLLKAEKKIDDKVIAENDNKIDKLSTELSEVAEALKDKEGMYNMIKSEMLAQKRNYVRCKEKLAEIEGPYTHM